MNITITHTLDPKVIDLFTSLLTGMQKPVTSTTKAAANGKSTMRALPAKADETEEAVTAPAAATEDTSTEAAIDLSVVRNAVSKQINANKDVRSLFGEFGIKKVSELRPDQYAAFVKKVEAL